MRPTVLLAAVLLIASACVVALATSGSRSPAPAKRSLFGPFAGYIWTGDVHSVSTRVVVPRILAGSPLGAAGTWIGATAVPDPRTFSAPFFQIGVNEFRDQVPSGGATTSYYVFWSSTKLDFHPRFLFAVRPGDVVTLAMTLAHGRWRMRATDETTGRTRTVTAAGGRGPFEQASWTQEDVAKNDAGVQLTYPKLATVRFSHMQVNSAVPPKRSLTTSWMSANNGTFGPTPASAGSFSVGRVHPSAADLRYQQIAFKLDYASIAFGHDLQRWTAATSQRTIRAACARLARALQTSAREFQRYRWPAAVRPLVKRLVAATRRSRAVVLALGASSPSKLSHETATFVKSGARITEIANKVRARLHVPKSNYSSGSIATYVRANSG
jgi:hypothetical protein